MSKDAMVGIPASSKILVNRLVQIGHCHRTVSTANETSLAGHATKSLHRRQEAGKRTVLLVQKRLVQKRMVRRMAGRPKLMKED